MGRRCASETERTWRPFDPFVGEPVRVTSALALKEAVCSQLSYVVAELGEGIRVRGESERLEDRGVDLGGAPGGELRSAMEEDLHQAKHARVVD